MSRLDHLRKGESGRKTVLVTGVGGRSVGFQILEALLSIPDRYDILVCDSDPTAYGLYCVDRRFLVPPVVQAKEYFEAIRNLVEQESIDAVIPGTEIELKFLSKQISELDELGVVLLASPAQVIDTCLDKALAAKWMEDNQISSARTVGVESLEELTQSVGFPIVAKPTDVTGGSRNVEILADRAEVRDYVERFPRDPKTLIFQEYVGTADSEYTVGVLTHRDGSIMDSLVIKRLVSGLSLNSERVIDGNRYVISSGYSQGVVLRDEAIQSFCESLALKLGARGPLNVQLRIDLNGSIKVFEIHPRFSGTTSIRSQAGFNEVDLALRSFLLGEKFERMNYQTDVLAVRAFKCQLTSLDDIDALPAASR